MGCETSVRGFLVWLKKQAMGNHESSKNIPPLKELVMLAAALEVDKRYLLEEVVKRIK